MNGFLSAGFTKADLLPVSIELLAANKSPINIAGAIIVRLQGYHKDRGKKFPVPAWSMSVKMLMDFTSLAKQ